MMTMELVGTTILPGLFAAIDPAALVEPSAAPLPAPVWFVQFFKMLGFALHAVPMSLWYAGLPLALWLHLRGNENARLCAARLLKQMPVIVAVGVNLGIVPLLFLQLAYAKFFYSATILMAWFWLAIVVLLIPAYYAIYIYAWGLSAEKGTGTFCRNGPPGAGHKRCQSPFPLREGMPRWKIAAGWLAALFFICIGFLFANGLSLIDHVQRWPDLWRANSVAAIAARPSYP